MSNLSYNANHAKSFQVGDEVEAICESSGGWYGVGFRARVTCAPFKNDVTGKWLFKVQGRGGTFECGNFRLFDPWQPGELVEVVQDFCWDVPDFMGNYHRVDFVQGMQFVISGVPSKEIVALVQFPACSGFTRSFFKPVQLAAVETTTRERGTCGQNHELQHKSARERTSLNAHYRRRAKALGLLAGWKFSIDYVVGVYCASSPRSQPNRTKFRAPTLLLILQHVAEFDKELKRNLHLVGTVKPAEAQQTFFNHETENKEKTMSKFYMIWLPDAVRTTQKRYEGDKGLEQAREDASNLVGNQANGVKEAYILEAVSHIRPTRNVTIEDL